MKLLDFANFLSSILPIFLLFSIIIGFYFFKRLDKIHKSIVIYLFFMFLVDIASRYILFAGSNYIVLLFFSLIELIMFVFFYFNYLLRKKLIIMLFISFFAIIYIVGEVFEYLIFNISISEFQPYSKVVDDFTIILLSLVYFWENAQYNNVTNEDWEYVKLNIIILIYFSLNLIFFLPFNFLINESTGLKFYFWIAITLITFLFYVYLTNLIWKNSRNYLTN